MAFIDDCLDSLSDYLAAQFAPYQPNIPPSFINLGPFAGQIQATEVGPGHPIQNAAMSRLENHLSAVYIYEQGELEKHIPFINDESTQAYTVAQPDGSQIQYLETDRSQVPVVCEIWSNTQPARKAVADLLRSSMGMYLRIKEFDQTTSLYRYIRTVKEDSEQKDSVYIYKVYFLLDYTVTSASQAWLVETTNLTLTPS